MAAKPQKQRLLLRENRFARAQKNRAVIKSVPAPVGGWNARDAFSEMEETDAVEMVNWFPGTTDVQLRYGSSRWQSGGARTSGPYFSFPGTQGSYITSSFADSGFIRRYLRAYGDASSIISTPDSAATSITGDIDIRALIALEDWSVAPVAPGPQGYNIIGKSSVSGFGGNAGWVVTIRTGGIINFIFSTDGTTASGNTQRATSALSANDGDAMWVRVTRISSTGVVAFYYSTDYNELLATGTWTSLGVTGTVTTGAMYDSTADLTVLPDTYPVLGGDAFKGKLFYAEVRNGVDGSIVASCNAQDATLTASTFVSTNTGETWTIAGNVLVEGGALTNIDIRVWLAADDWTTSAATGNNIISRNGGAGDLGWNVRIIAGFPRFDFSTDGTNAATTQTSTAAISATDGDDIWLRVTRTSGGVLRYYTSTDYNYVLETGTWTQLGDDCTTDAGNLFKTTAQLVLSRNTEAGSLGEGFLGVIHYAEVRQALLGTKIAVCNAADSSVGSTTFQSSVTGEGYTIAGTALATSGAGTYETLMAYSSPTVDKLFAIENGSIFDVTTQNARSQETPILQNSRAQYVNVSTPGGSFLYLVNGADDPYTYDNTDWDQPYLHGYTASQGAKWDTAVWDTDQWSTIYLSQINLHKNRVWFVEKDSLKAWYLPTQSIAGAMNQLDLSSFASKGGFLMAMATWTLDAGEGMDDMAVFITSNGQVLVYAGTDPANAATWGLIGIFEIGAPIGRRCFTKYRGDVLLVTKDGVVPLSGALIASRTNPLVSLSDKIRSAMVAATASYGSNFGWQVIHYPAQNMVLVNVPVNEGRDQEQYVMNTITGSWCRFRGWEASCWEVFKNDLYFAGQSGVVRKAWVGESDDSDDIEGSVLQAFSEFGSTSQTKRYTMMRPTFMATGNTPVDARMNTDYDMNIAVGSTTDIVVNVSKWDSAIWDASAWTNEFGVSRDWRGAQGDGYVAAPFVGVSTDNRHIRWVQTDVVLEPGGVL